MRSHQCVDIPTSDVSVQCGRTTHGYLTSPRVQMREWSSRSFLCVSTHTTPVMCTSSIPVLLTILLISSCYSQNASDTSRDAEQVQAENALAKLVKMFSKPGAFKRIDAILGENIIEQPSSCPKGEEGLECRRAEARRSVDCPRGDCYCSNCAAAGPELWASCCRDSLRCCSHLAAACRTCDQPTLYPFCSKHFKKCTAQHNEKKQN